MLTTLDLKRLDRQTVLVRTTADQHNPPTGVRGWIRVLDTGEAPASPRIDIVVEFPDMYNVPAHERIIHLDERQIEQLVASERAGWFEITLTEPIDETPDGPRTNIGQP